MNVLIVENDAIQANALNIILKDAFPNMKFHKVLNFDSALEMINTISFQLFLLDVDLEENDTSNDGVKLDEHIRSIENNQTTPILYLTGKSDIAKGQRGQGLPNLLDLVEAYEGKVYIENLEVSGNNHEDLKLLYNLLQSLPHIKLLHFLM